MPAGKEVTYSATEANAKNWGWVLGDGTAAGRAVRHTYSPQSVGGPLSGSLYVYADGVRTVGDNTCSFKINVVLGPPSAGVSVSGADRNPDGSYQGEAGKTILLTGVEPNASIYAWDFGDGTSEANEQATDKVYDKAGTYTVKLTVTGDGKLTTGVSVGMRYTPSDARAGGFLLKYCSSTLFMAG